MIEIANDNGVWLPDYFQTYDGPVFHGYSLGRSWNGWHMPSFEYGVACQVAVLAGGAAYDPKADAFWFDFEQAEGEEYHEYKGHWITINDQHVKVYPIGAGAWVWEKSVLVPRP